MGHDHHHPVTTLSKVNAAFTFGIVLNFAFVIIEAAVGFYIHSLSLLSDAAHNLADVGTLALSLLAFRLLKVRASEQYTYGYRKTSILVALFNSVVLLVSIGGITFEAVHRSLSPPEPLPGKVIALVAGIGIVINAVTALLFFREKEKDINIKSAYLHLMSDAIVSAGIVVGGLVIYLTHWYWVDSALSIIIAGVILISTWRLLKASLRLSLDGVPENIDLSEIKSMALHVAGVKDIHHIHIWAISSTENAMTAHLVTTNNITAAQEHDIKNHLKHELLHKNIQHITLETEKENEVCTTEVC
ncbi:cation diffusion facilitator family transporter [Dolichospermum sp. ST_sed3]|nr:cation diffusion facilitator family transporter [Dolichospermum sp. ST_sed3]